MAELPQEHLKLCDSLVGVCVSETKSAQIWRAIEQKSFSHFVKTHAPWLTEWAYKICLFVDTVER
jgi:hypothetical protein